VPRPSQHHLAEDLAELLRREGLLIEAEGRTVEQLESTLPKYSRQDIVAALCPLVAAGLVQRGRSVECPRCRFAAFLALRELDEQVQCRGCGLDYLLPVIAGRDEALTAYRVDGLMARVLDQHILPVILAIRALRDPSSYLRPQHIWPGVLLESSSGEQFEVDVLASDGVTVIAAECKLDGRNLRPRQLRKLLDFASRTGAKPAIAALVGEFSPQIRRMVEKRDGIVLCRDDLLTIRAPISMT